MSSVRWATASAAVAPPSASAAVCPSVPCMPCATVRCLVDQEFIPHAAWCAHACCASLSKPTRPFRLHALACFTCEAAPCHICTGTGLSPATSAPGLGSPPPHLHQDWARPCHLCTRTGRPRKRSALWHRSAPIFCNTERRRCSPTASSHLMRQSQTTQHSTAPQSPLPA